MGTNERYLEVVNAMLAAADKHDADAEKIRPPDGPSNIDEIENDAIATALDERAAELREFARQVGSIQPVIDVESSASRQHFIDTGRYLTPFEVAEYVTP
jgi:hypothetical protein